jgi:hypothetical protein
VFATEENQYLNLSKYIGKPVIVMIGRFWLKYISVAPMRLENAKKPNH